MRHIYRVSAIIVVVSMLGSCIEKADEKHLPDMIRMEAGEFQMGSVKGRKDERPVHIVFLDEFYIDKYEVTVIQYGRCVDAGRCQKPETGEFNNWGRNDRQSHPVNGVDWNDAEKYCGFAGKRLPSEAEWEKAATWKDGRKIRYLSGKSSISCEEAVIWDTSKKSGVSVLTADTWNSGWGCGEQRTWKVGSKKVEINGTYDMAGNVWEWVLDWHSSYTSENQRNPKGPSSGSHRVLRGGSWGSLASHISGTRRGFENPESRGGGIGFRCAVSP